MSLVGSSRLIFILVMIVTIFSGMVLATSLGLSVKRIGSGEALVEKTHIKVTSIEDYAVGSPRNLRTVYVTLVSDVSGTYRVTLTVSSGAGSRTVTQTVTLNANIEKTITFAITPPLREDGGFKHYVEVVKL